MKSMILAFLTATSAFALEVQGHRGARALRPENTLPAFELAIANGVDTLELDLAVTSDDILVVSHDPFINPEHCINAEGQPAAPETMIHSLPLKKVQAYDCGSRKNPRFPKQQTVPQTKIPRFADVIQLLKDTPLPAGKTVQLNIETKIYPGHPDWTVDPQKFVKLILEQLKPAHLIARTTVESFDDRTLLIVKKLEPQLRTALLTSDNHLDFAAAVKSAKADILSPDFEWILPDDVKAIHKLGKRVIPWTVNEPAAWDRLIAMNVDGIITDDPVALIDYLKQKKLRK